MEAMIRFLDCRIEPLQDGIYQLTHSSGARWYPSSLRACQEVAAKAWVLHRSHPTAAIKKQGWCIANRYALELGWPYTLYKLYPNQIYWNITQLSHNQGIWRDIAYQKVLVSDEELLLIESLIRAISVNSEI